ncbi:hypothetical protein HYW76_00720 [Candidatus Pacearchaeota archaeon]|nr:hypothetical protein [Candidatus Pacearchaeota archaeon]
MKTISIPQDLHKQLVNLKLELGEKNAAELIFKLLIVYRQQKFLKIGELFRKKLKEKNIEFEDLLKKSRNGRRI